jgi:kynureninase
MTAPALGAYQLGAEFAAQRDAEDELARFRDDFYLLPDRIYLDGNSLGLLSRSAETSILEALADWRLRAIEGWTSGERPWFWLGEELGARHAGLVGALPSEIAVCGAITINLHALLATFYTPSGSRTKIVATSLDFPSDVYALQSWLRLRGHDPAQHLVLVGSHDGRLIEESDIIAALDDSVALAWLPSVLYRSGQLLDVERLTHAAHARGISIGFDLAHSAGCVPHQLHDWGVDFATWCTYKYLNAGPGAVGALFVHERNFPANQQPGLRGWWGSDKARQFDMQLEFTPASGAGAWQISTPSVLGAAALYGSLGLIQAAGLDALRRKSLDLTGYLVYLADARLAEHGFCVGTPREPARRGGHVALEHPEALRISRALRAHGVISDFRAPNVVRLAPVALYTTYTDVWRTVEILRQITSSGAYLRFDAARGSVD